MNIDMTKYTDYRDFIKDIIQLKKTNQKRFSYAVLGNKINTSKSYFKLISDKKRHISLDKIMPFCAFFNLSDIEKQYLIFLFLHNTSKNKNTQILFNNILVYLKHSIHRQNDISNSTDSIESLQDIEQINSWVVMLLLEIANLKYKFASITDLHSFIGGEKIIPFEKFENIFNELLQKQLITLNKVGQITSTKGNKVFDFQPYFPTNMTLFQTVLKRISNSFANPTDMDVNNPSRYHAYVAAINAQTQLELLKIYEKFEKDILKLISISNNNDPDRVIIVSNNLFKITHVYN